MNTQIENDKPIILHTIGDLRKYTNKILAFSYEDNGKEILYMKRIATIPYNWKDHMTLNGNLQIYGSNVCILKPFHGKKPYVKNFNKISTSNNYSIIRTPTKQELDIYNNMLRYYKLFKKETFIFKNYGK